VITPARCDPLAESPSGPPEYQAGTHTVFRDLRDNPKNAIAQFAEEIRRLGNRAIVGANSQD
jgi:hypothetical protein